MEYVNFGRSGLKVSRLCLGCMSYGSPDWRPWVLDERDAKPFFKKALKAGINFFDTADFYGLGRSEEVTGKHLKSLARRDEIVIATKVGLEMGTAPNSSGLSRKHILFSIDRSLKRLKTDHVDLYQIHRLDRSTPMEEIVNALDEVVRAGKARYIGTSSMHAWEFMKLLALQGGEGLARFISMQNHYNLLYREEEREMIPLCRSEGVAIMPWSPLARGVLTRPAGKAATKRIESDTYTPTLYGAPHDRAILEAVAKAAGKLERSMAQVALAWVLSRPGVTAPIIGATRLEQLDEAIAATSLK
ncbi:MAG: aldo/keto reductase, partial [Pseudomonadota bacterium]|nr:aldo/keto reductase [Pseudomonadota bacterium]